MIISLIAAMDQNRLIGQGNRLPWRLPADMKHFRKLTLGKPVVMGRRTFESIGNPLAKRTNIILTRDLKFRARGCIVARSVDDALEKADDCEELMIIGGHSVYEQFLRCAARFYLTKIHECFEGDVYFPQFELSDWREVRRIRREPDSDNPHSYDFVFLHRTPSSD
ncbi:MAG: dihydrofolate reductase [Candidatus Poribacteria bacterium]|nr:dihydrofolate reductase [Candidatus Poribacteria bacterium]MDE0503832.1 dihydrofolate reductase [Candidatus Poribacteria bacterium]